MIKETFIKNGIPVSYTHLLAILGGTGPMGFLAIDYAIHNDRRPKHLVVTGRTQSKLDMAKRLYPVEEAAKYGVTLTLSLIHISIKAD